MLLARRKRRRSCRYPSISNLHDRILLLHSLCSSWDIAVAQLAKLGRTDLLSRQTARLASDIVVENGT